MPNSVEKVSRKIIAIASMEHESSHLIRPSWSNSLSRVDGERELCPRNTASTYICECKIPLEAGIILDTMPTHQGYILLPSMPSSANFTAHLYCCFSPAALSDFRLTLYN